MEVKVSNVSYLVEKEKNKFRSYLSKYSSKNEREKVLLLKDCTIDFKPGSVTATLGSGSGHKKLLECIALRQTEGFMSGGIQYDSSVRRNGAFKDIVFMVDTGSSHFDSLTVFDYLFYSARLRVSHGNIECRERARVVAKVTGLDGSCKVGKLTRGEQRLLNIAAELVGYPTLICLADPLEGLDAASGIEVMHALHRVAKRVSMPSTVIFVVDGLNTDMVRYVDNVAIFAGVSLVQQFRLKSLNATTLSGVKALLTDMSVQMLTFEEGEKEHESLVGSNKDGPSLEDIVRKYALDIGDLITTAASTSLRTVKKLPAHPTTPGAIAPEAVNGGAAELEFSTEHLGIVDFDANDDDDDTDLPKNNRPARHQVSVGGWSTFVPARSNTYSGMYSTRSSGGAGDRGSIPKLVTNSNDFVSSSRRLGELGVPARTYKPLGQELLILCSRAFKYHHKNRIQVRMGLARFLIAGILLGILAFRDGNDQHLDNRDLISNNSNATTEFGIVNSSAYNVTSALFVVVALSVVGMSFAVQYMHANARILKLEVAAGLHSTLSSWLSIILVEVPLFVIAAVAIAGIVRLMVDIHGHPGAYYGTVIAVTLSGYSLASACATWCSSVYTATFYFALWGAINIVFTGFLQTIPLLPGMWPWATTTAFTRWAFESLMVSAFDPVTDGIAYLTLYGFEAGTTRFCLTWMLVWLASLQGLVVVGLLPPVSKLKLIESEDNHIRRLDNDTAGDNTTIGIDPAVMEANTNRNKFAGFVTHDASERFLVVPIKPSAQVSLNFQRVKYVDNNSQGNGGDMIILGICGNVEPGGSLCILDGNGYGAGITLLQVLAGRARSMGKVSGTIRANGAKLRRGLTYLNAAYVEAGDISLSSVTVRETIRYAGLLRRTDQSNCPGVLTCFREMQRLAGMAPKGEYLTLDASDLIGKTGDVDDRVEEVIKMMGLAKVANVPLANSRNECNLTPAQLRCVTIAVELVNRPGLIFMEDPLAGLNWHDADIVAAGIQALAQGGRTIIATLSTPSQRVHETFTDTLLLSSGMMIYFGTTAKASDYFDNIGFERSENQNSLQYIMRIAGDLGEMKPTASGRRATTLSPEDLSDLCRSLLNIGGTGRKSKAGVKGKYSNVRSLSNHSSGRFDAVFDDEDDDYEASTNEDASSQRESNDGSVRNSVVAPPTNEMKKKSKTIESSTVIGVKKQPAIGPASRVLVWRAFQQTFSDKTAFFFLCLRYLLAGLLVGSVWWKIQDGNYQQRVSLFAVAYFALNVAIVDQLEGIHDRKAIFLRESTAGASNYVAFWIADSAALQTLHLLSTFLFTVPIYWMSSLRSGWGYFGYFYLMSLVSNYCNLGLAYILSTYCRSSRASKMIFNGIIIPLQLLIAGYLFLLPTMDAWYKWGAYICPMSYYLGGNFDNEFDGNNAAIGSNSWNDITDFYGFSISKWTAFIALVAIGVIYRILWLLSLKSIDMARKREVLLKVGKMRKKAKLIVAAGLRWTLRTSSASQNLEDDAYAELEFGTAMMSGGSNPVVSNLHSANYASYATQMSSQQQPGSPPVSGPGGSTSPTSTPIGLPTNRSSSGSGRQSLIAQNLSQISSLQAGGEVDSLTPSVSSFASTSKDAGIISNMVSSPLFPSPLLTRGSATTVWSRPVQQQVVAPDDDDTHDVPDFDDPGSTGEFM